MNQSQSSVKAGIPGTGTFQNAFYQLLHASTLEEGVINTIQSGGDTDTNAAIAGALLGAVHGRHGIPSQWVDRVLTCRAMQDLQGVKHGRPAAYWPIDALALAERLLIVGLESSGKREFPESLCAEGSVWEGHTFEFKQFGPIPEPKDFDVVLGFIPMLEKSPIDSLYGWAGGDVSEEGVFTISRPFPDWKIVEFIRSLIGHGFVQQFDWMEWGDERSSMKRTLIS
jgi:hypothetical protein